MNVQSITTVIALSLCCSVANAQQLSRVEELTVDEVIAKSFSNDAGVKSFGCQFQITVGQAQNEDELRSGQFHHVRGNAVGRWLILNDCELFEFTVGDVFEMIPVQDENGVTKSVSVAFPGPQTMLKNDNFILSISWMFGVGRIGSHDIFNPDVKFHPRLAMCAVGTERWADPLYWFIEPPAPVTHTLSREGSVVTVTSRMDHGTFRTSFDEAANFLLTSFEYTQDGSTGKYFVSETLGLDDGSYVPRVAHAVFADHGQYPKKTARWEITEVLDHVDAAAFRIDVLKRLQVRHAATFNNITHLESGMQVRPDSLGAIHDAAFAGREINAGK